MATTTKARTVTVPDEAGLMVEGEDEAVLDETLGDGIWRPTVRHAAGCPGGDNSRVESYPMSSPLESPYRGAEVIVARCIQCGSHSVNGDTTL